MLSGGSDREEELSDGIRERTKTYLTITTA
jgi:hypothetical protein